MPINIIQWKKVCDNCGEDIIHRTLDLTQEDDDRVTIDVDSLYCTQKTFVCSDCSASHDYGDIDYGYRPPEES